MIGSAAVVVIDMQNDFVRAGAPLEVPGIRKTIPPIQKLIAAARASSIPVIYTRFVAGPKRTLIWDYTPQIAADKACWRGVYRKYKDSGKELLCLDVVDEIYPAKDDYVVDKYSYNAFLNTNLIDILNAEAARTIIVSGTVTNVCVGNTVYAAFQNNIEPIVGRDAVSSWDEELNNSTLRNIEGKFGKVLAVEEIIANLMT